MEMKILRPGILTTVQDLGRYGHRQAGIPISGALDVFAARIANSLVGNHENSGVLEMTFVGAEIEFTDDAWVAFGGGDFDGIEAWKPRRIVAGERLKIGTSSRGARGYLAIAGGIEVPMIMGSRSTYLRGGFGGHEGRALRADDVLALGPAAPLGLGAASQQKAGNGTVHAHVGDWRIDPKVLPHYSATAVVRVLVGANAAEFGESFQGTEFTVSPQSDRMGVRLTGAKLIRSRTEELLSSAVAPGTIQVPPDGDPIVLLGDAQTIGGYPQIGHVIGIDLPVIAQLRPGDRLQFNPITLQEAHRLSAKQEHAIALLREGLVEKARAATRP